MKQIKPLDEKMLDWKRTLITLGVIVGVIIFAVGVLYLKSISAKNPEEEIVKCIAEKSVLYVQEGCPHCLTQQQRFGDKLELLNIVDCTKTPKECILKGIRSIPTWIFNDTYITGSYSIEELKEMMGC